jgi:FtsP/CotA-like multicopper oxidase with cupredoxin domain
MMRVARGFQNHTLRYGRWVILFINQQVMTKQAMYALVGVGVVVVLALVFLSRPYFPFGGGVSRGETFSQETDDLPMAVASKPIELADGDTYELVASMVQKTINGKVVKMLAYNGSIPGPLMKVTQGSQVTINFKNDTDVVTTLHSHGVRLNNKFDGTSPLTQRDVKPGGTFTYEIKFPDAGLFWYHPHVREDYAQELGLYGNFLVTPQDSSYWSPVNREVSLVLDDVLLNGEGQIVAFNTKEADHTLMGRFGNVLLVNGETDFKLEAGQGDVIRFYITNVANTRPFNVEIPGAKMKLVGGDGGKYEREEFVDSVILGPSERAIVEVLFEKAGSFALQHKTPEKTYVLGSIDVKGGQGSSALARVFNQLRTNSDVIASIDPLRSMFGKMPDKNLVFTLDMMGMGNMNMGGMHTMDLGIKEALAHGHESGGHVMPGGSMMMGSDDPIEWEDDMAAMNQTSTTQSINWMIVDRDTRKTNMKIDWKFKVGDKVKIRIVNDGNSMHPMQHPLHFHGQQFLVLSNNGVPNENLVWKDTVMVGAGEIVDILVDMSNPGEWMAHCHIAEHLEDGMMFSYKVNP